MKRSTLKVVAVLLTLPFITGPGCNPCGNGKLEPEKGEQCDDGGTLPADGCSATCQLETQETCVQVSRDEMIAAARAADSRFDATLALAPTWGLSTTLDPVEAYACNEGFGTTTWIARLAPNGAIAVRVDAPPGLRTSVWAYLSPKDADVHFEGAGFHLHPGQPTTVLNPTPPPAVPPGPIASPTSSEECTPAPSKTLVPCHATQHATEDCIAEHLDLVNAVGYGSLLLYALENFLQHGGSPWALVGYGTLLFGRAWLCQEQRPSCMTSGCQFGRCGMTTCYPEPPETPASVTLCDHDCQTCGVDEAGDPACRGIAIRSIDYPTDACFDDPAGVPVTITYCGWIPPGTPLLLWLYEICEPAYCEDPTQIMMWTWPGPIPATGCPQVFSQYDPDTGEPYGWFFCDEFTAPRPWIDGGTRNFLGTAILETPTDMSAPFVYEHTTVLSW